MDSSSAYPARRHRRAASHATPTAIAPTLSTRHVSAPSPDPARSPRTASSIMITVKRSLAPSSSKRRQDSSRNSHLAMYSTPEERMPPQRRQSRTFQSHSDFSGSAAPPTIEQIAMGLHVSRTPHLRPLASSRNPYSRAGGSAPAHSHAHTPISLPPPPARSSMKKPTATVSSGSSHVKRSVPTQAPSTATTRSASLAHSSVATRSTGFSFSNFARMGRFLSSRSSSAPSSSLISTPVSSPRESTSDLDVVQKKAVRFQRADDGDED
ncbi:hypothetical protein FA15DRAFT_663816 [Coprinopsis marcescibilis]|uniref:Uncharacterized protein n=1 Tax=Coprinopsis marcescibilis TaxID=230819 RepID=A0A5C3LA64_COPMA|nr:hypothetical protein FA15DRAFT_663816 [Coprinopsis marcescibilis]